MLTTGCNGCCFLRQDGKDKGCVLSRVSVLGDDGKVFAPGYCRTCRSYNWQKQQNETDIGKLLNKVNEENVLKFDLLVFFDENVHSVEHLTRTIESDWYIPYAQKIIIVDTTGFGETRKNLALQYIRSKEHSIPIFVDSSVVNEQMIEREATIRRISKQVTAPFFMTIQAGGKINNINILAASIRSASSRVIHWSFPFTIGNTTITQDIMDYGLFITKPYRELTRSIEAKPFSQRLKIEETETKIKLSCCRSECVLV